VAYPAPCRRKRVLQLTTPIRHLQNGGDAWERSVILIEEFPDTISALVIGLRAAARTGFTGPATGSRLRQFLVRRHKVRSRGTRQFPNRRLYQEYGLRPLSHGARGDFVSLA
jgi:hypothetical protein